MSLSRGGEENVVVSLAELSRLYLQLGWAYELSSQFAQAESIYEELLTLARMLHEPVMECAALNRLATQAAQNSQHLARAEELLQQALAIAESSQNKAGVAETAWNLAQTGFYAAKMAASLPHAERALALARELNEQELIGRSLHALATLEVALGRQKESLSHAEEARILYAALGNRVREVGCLCVIAKANIEVYFQNTSYGVQHVTSDATGSFTTSLVLPSTCNPHVPYFVYAKSTSGQDQASAKIVFIIPTLNFFINGETFGHQVILNAKGFAANEGVKLYWNFKQTGQLLVTTATADTNGMASFAFNMPSDPALNNVIVAAVGATSKLSAIISTPEQATVIDNPLSGQPGTTLNISGGGFGRS